MLPKLAVPRPYFEKVPQKFKIVYFSDASSRAYGAVVYLCSAYCTVLVCSKSHVAPLKEITIPRLLELIGAVLLTRLVACVCRVLNYSLLEVQAFIDSNIVLAWLRCPGDKLQTFMRNRLLSIIEVIPCNQWQYVNSLENPTDLLTCGISAVSLTRSQL